MQKDSTVKTILVAAILCVVCSILVATSAVGLKPLQDANKALDIKKNLLLASGLIDSSASKKEILEKYKSIKAEVISLETGEVQPDMNAETFDQRKARKMPSMSKAIAPEADSAGIKTRSKFSTVYKVMKDGQVDMIVLPINGKGLWSTLYGFIALSPNLEEIRGLGFYEHGETPGLGGEVDNPLWKAQWKGKTPFDENGNPKIQVIKGTVNPADPQANYKVDGLSGATITAYGVSGLVQYWLGQDGFGPYLKKMKAGL
jgi:Na+-transporting NADH:ubiquinone oxidoreductase subunit C